MRRRESRWGGENQDGEERIEMSKSRRANREDWDNIKDAITQTANKEDQQVEEDS